MGKERKNRVDSSGKAMITFINNICDNIGPRISGSKQEKETGNLIHDEMASFCDSVDKFHFKCRPGGFLDFIWLTAIFYYLGVVFYYIVPIFTPILLIIALVIYSLQQNFLYEIVDFLFKEVSTFHVIGKIYPKQSPKKLVLISGHHDSAYEFPLFSKLGEKSSFVIIGAVVIAVLNILLAIIRLLFSSSPPTNPFPLFENLSIIQPVSILDTVQFILFIIGLILVSIIAYFLRSNNVVMGANDNLTAVATIIECGKYLANHKPNETEVWIISFAGEENMRGSKRFVSKFGDELTKRNGMLLNLETLSADKFLLATQETMFLAKHSDKVIDLVKSAADQVEIPVEVGPLPFAGSDAANFSRKGLHATTLFGLSEKGTPPHWHTLEDTSEKLNGSKIARAAEIVLQFIENVDHL